MKETLVILAAGMGSRYGGLKQIDTIGSNGESIIDFTIYDAIKVGFKKLVLIIRKEHEELFEENLVKKVRPFIEVEYAYQDINDLPNGYTVPEGRAKPWGTTHALMACRDILKDDPFIVCNADDFYGRDTFQVMYDFFQNGISDSQYCMAGFKLGNTLSDHGTVTRAICGKDENGNLTSIKEVMSIKKSKTGAEYEEYGIYVPIDVDTPVSMNFFGFKPNVITKLQDIFTEEFPEGVKNNPLKYEALLPNHVGVMVNKGLCSVKVLPTNSNWFGVTYKEDKPIVVDRIQQMKDSGIYPQDLWAK
ncbi:MAG: sugar phosphate nucleotidyltransferase [Erysipelotrichaceae bacterium]|nr:sugar phosphate nucleotidyltransferase [Erysipelotrichaceae bacterium]